jgi:predicted small lipoprotein YifL
MPRCAQWPLVAAGLALLAACGPAPLPEPPAAVATAGMRCKQQTLWRVYFGADTSAGPVSASAWHTFVRDDIVPRLPAGHTLLQAVGPWRDAAGTAGPDEARVLEVVGEDGLAARQALAEIVGRYKLRFRQRQVLLTQLPVRACGA